MNCSLSFVISNPLLPVPPDLSLTPDTLFHAVSTVTDFWEDEELLHCLIVPGPVREQIPASPSYSSEDERRMAGLKYYLQTVPGASWGRIAGVLWWMEEHTALETVRQYLPHEHGECIQSCSGGIFLILFMTLLTLMEYACSGYILRVQIITDCT